MNTEFIGKRLAQLRDELACPGEDKWTQARVSAETGLTLNMIGNMELSGAARIEAFLDYLLFFQKRGYNLNWILTPNNANISKMILSESTKAIDVIAAVHQLNVVRQAVGKEIDSAIAVLES
ncbi:hypothetical protein [Hymenobacter sp. BT491]|uniref:hypothetical protein n=1 Tax=Hymenobacter sp. BT491 TaxID=2766779 RepID=UPI001653C940|nr:hypothetical protein [Hymenobacter sp. BT491]MBC6992512.1 hypothetical protein [Hymenobacter sp. BT491]